MPKNCRMDEEEKGGVDPILQEFYDGFVWDETDLGCDVNPDAVWDKSRQSNILVLLKLCGHDPDDLTRMDDTNITPVPVVPRVTPAPVSVPVPFPKESCLTLKQMRTYLVWEQRYKFVDNAQNVTQGSRAGFRDYQAMKNKVLMEQEEYQQYLSRAALQAIQKYNYIDPEAREWVKNKMHAASLDLKRYPRYYVNHKIFGINVVPFVTDSLPTQIDARHEFLGCAKNLKTRKFPAPLSPDFLAKSDRDSEKPVISEDKNAAVLATAWDADVVVSMSSLHVLADNFGKFEKAWELPVTVRKHGSKKIVFIDRPLPPKFIMPRERNLLYFRKLYKAAMNVNATPRYPPQIGRKVNSNSKNLQGNVNKKSNVEPGISKKMDEKTNVFDPGVQDVPKYGTARIPGTHGVTDDSVQASNDQSQGASVPGLLSTERIHDKIVTPQAELVEDEPRPEKVSSNTSDSEYNSAATSYTQKTAMAAAQDPSEKPCTSVMDVSKIKTENICMEDDTEGVGTHITVQKSKSSSDEFTSSDTNENVLHHICSDKNANNNNHIAEQSLTKSTLNKPPSTVGLSGPSASSDEDTGLVIDVTDESDVPQLDGASDDKPKSKKPRAASARKRAPKKPRRKANKLEPPSEDSLDLTPLEEDFISSMDEFTVAPAGCIEVGATPKNQPAGFDTWKSSFTSLPRSNFVKVGVSKPFGSTATFQPYTRKTSSEASENEGESTAKKADRNKRKSSSGGTFELSFGASANLLIDESAIKQEDEPKKKNTRKKPAARAKVPQVVLEKIDSPARDRSSGEAVPTTSKSRKQTGKRSTKTKQAESSPVVSLSSENSAADQAEVTKAAAGNSNTISTVRGGISSLEQNPGTKDSLLSQHRIFSLTVKVPTHPTPKARPTAPKQAGMVAPVSDVLGQIMMGAGSTTRPQKSGGMASLPPTETNKKRPEVRKIRETEVDVNSLEPPADSENVGYALWQFKDKRVLVRYTLHGTMLSNEKKDPMLFNVSFQTKLEYQSDFAYEQVTPSEICHNWVTMYFKPPGTRIVRGRIDPFKRKLLDVEWPTSHDVMGKAALLGFSPHKASKCMSNIFDKLADLESNSYLCSHKSSEKEVSILKRVEEPMKHVVYDIADVYKYPGRDAIYTAWVPWVPADPDKQLPLHKHKKIIPLMFTPRGEPDKQPKKRSSSVKGKKRGRKKKSKRLCDTNSSEDSAVSD